MNRASHDQPRIAVMGAGAVGGYLGGLLARAGNSVVLIVRGDHLRAIQRHGLRVQSPVGDFTVFPQVTDQPAGVGQVDLVLYAVKTYQNRDAIPQTRPLVGPNTTVLSLQNGVESWEELRSGLDAGHVLPAAIYIEASIRAPGVIRQQGNLRRLVLGEPDGAPSPRVEAVAALLGAAGMPTVASEEILGEVWSKWLFITALAGVTTARRISMAEALAAQESRALLVGVMREAEAVARRNGIALAEDIVERTLGYMEAEAASLKASMQTDLERGRPLELEAFNGAVIRLGQACGVPTPANQEVYTLLKPYASGGATPRA